jgi:cysteine desulfuration protein SufE
MNADMNADMNFDAIREDFEFLDDWEDRYRYVIELGRKLDPLPESEHNEANKVHGCVSQVWLQTRIENDGDKAGDESDPILHFRGDSDAHIVRGLVAIVLSLFSGRRASEIMALDAESELAGLGLDEHLTPQRSNGLAAMLARIREEARKAMKG